MDTVVSRAVTKPTQQNTNTAEVKQLQTIPSATENVSEQLFPPVDFSFLHLTTLEDAEREEPRKPVLGKCHSPRAGEKFRGRSLRLNNNQLSEIKTIKVFSEKTFVQPMWIGWIDLSFNALPMIDSALLEFKNLEILYLHSNCISNIKEVDKLAHISSLRKLTLHGNSIEKEKDYRLYVLSTIPSLRNFDFSPITKCDGRTAETWKRLNNSNKKKKKIVSED